MKHILCPTDLSEPSAHAAELAVTLAGYNKSRIMALHVLSPLRFEVSGTVRPPQDAGELERRRRDTATQFDTTRGRDVHVDVVVDVGQPVDVILARATSLPADVIVMSTHGVGGFQHLVLGSVTEKVLRKATCPVLAVPPHALAGARLPFERVLCGVDFSDASLRAVQSALSLVRESDAALTLVHVLEWPWGEPPAPRIEDLRPEQGRALAEFRRASEETARKRLASLVPGWLPVSRVAIRVENGKPYVQVLRVAAEEQSDLIIMGVCGRSPIDLTLFGSTTNQIVRRATCPVLTVH